MIKITSSDKTIRLISNYNLFKPQSGFLLITVSSANEMSDYYHTLMKNKEVREIFLYNESEEFLLDCFKSIFKVVEAAGGLVKNDKGEYLFIFRNGKWDLPKGKIEKGEAVKTAAVREVEEECGVGGLTIIKELTTSYHTYILHEKEILKPTYWFEMSCPGNAKLVPQTEEGITDVRWMGVKDLEMIRKNTYPSIFDLISEL